MNFKVKKYLKIKASTNLLLSTVHSVVNIAASTKILMNLCSDNDKINKKLTNLANDIDFDTSEKKKVLDAKVDK